MKKIPLTQGQFALVDDEDFEKFGSLNWYAHLAPTAKTFYAVRSIPGTNKKSSLHREIFGITDPRIRVDHKNHNGLDCRRKTNLRACTHSQNIANRRGANESSKSGIRGVWWIKDKELFAAGIQVNGKRKHLGYFKDAISASRAYAKANKEFFGKFGGKF